MIEQIVIFTTGIAAVWLSQDEKSAKRKYACLFGMTGQPFWLYASYQASQWGILILSIVYTIAWMKGLYVFWIKSNEDTDRH